MQLFSAALVYPPPHTHTRDASSDPEMKNGRFTAEKYFRRVWRDRRCGGFAEVGLNLPKMTVGNGLVTQETNTTPKKESRKDPIPTEIKSR